MLPSVLGSFLGTPLSELSIFYLDNEKHTQGGMIKSIGATKAFNINID